MKKASGWLVLIGMAIAVIWGSYAFIKSRSLDIAVSAGLRSDNGNGKIDLMSPVVINFQDNRYHRPDCPFNVGPGERVVLKQAIAKEITPCPSCFPSEP